MKAQVVLTPTESKKLIAKAVLKYDSVKRALQEGMVVLHPSSSTYFIVEEFIGKAPDTKVWVVGVIVPRGTCVEASTQKKRFTKEKALKQALMDPGDFIHSWVIKKGQFYSGVKLSDLLNELGKNDVYIKGVNALDSQGVVGVLRTSLAEGTIGKVVAASQARGFEIVCPVGYEKLLPGSLKEAAKTSKGKKDYAMGCMVNLLPVEGTTAITEIDAFKILTGATATPIAAGGLAGAEGAITLIIDGEKEEVELAINYAEQVKGVQLPPINLPLCEDCTVPSCMSAGRK